jgi:hypothetical protein
MQVYKSDYQLIHVDVEKKLLKKEWYATTDTMKTPAFMREVEKIAELAEKYSVEKFHDDTTLFAYPIAPDVQTWVNEEIFPRFIKAGLKKYAIIVSKEMIAQLSIEQTMEENNASSFQVKYFDNPTKAQHWLEA